MLLRLTAVSDGFRRPTPLSRPHKRPAAAATRRQHGRGVCLGRPAGRACASAAGQPQGAHALQPAVAEAATDLARELFRYRPPSFWTAELGVRLEAAVQQLGGPAVASTNGLRQLLPGEGLTYHQARRLLVKLHDRQTRAYAEAVGVTQAPCRHRPSRCLTAVQQRDFDNAMEDQGGAEWATARRTWQSIRNKNSVPLSRVHKLLRRERDAQQQATTVELGEAQGGQPSAGPNGGGSAQQEFAPIHGWRPGQHHRFVESVHSLGGPFLAPVTPMLYNMNHHLSRAQLRAGLKRWRDAEHGRAAAQGVTLVLQRSTPHLWTPAVIARLDAAVADQGGLPFATSKRTLKLYQAGAGDPTPVDTVRLYLFGDLRLQHVTRRLSELRKGRHGGGSDGGGTTCEAVGGGGRLTNCLPSAQVPPPLPPVPLVLAPLVRGWTPTQQRRFTEAVSSLGGPFAASVSRIFKQMPDEGLTQPNIRVALQKLRRRVRGEAEEMRGDEAELAAQQA